jgi:ectoine utilization protein EutC
MSGILIVSEQEIRGIVTLEEVIPEMEKAFAAYSQKAASLPSVIHLDVPRHHGEVHIKAGHLHEADDYVVKVASGFWENRLQNLPIGSGLMMVFSAETGFPQAMLLDNGYLTEIRTAAAGAVAAKYMSTNSVDQIAILGAGAQGRYQLLALHLVRSFKRVLVYDHHSNNTERYLQDMRSRLAVEIEAVDTVEKALRGSRIVITTTPSREPIVRVEWVEPGTHITAMGSDGSDKQELDVEVLKRADRIIADSLPQCIRIGEIHHAIEAGKLRQEDVDGEIGDVVLGRIPGRTTENEITVCDLTGVGVQDAAIAGLVYRKASQLGIGSWF